MGRTRIGDALVVAAVTITAIYLTQPNTFVLRPNGLDPLFYLGYSIQPSKLINELSDRHYFVTRWSGYLPNSLFIDLLGLQAGRLFYRFIQVLVLTYLVFKSLLRLSRNASLLKVSVLVAILLTNPLYSRSLFTDYVENAFVFYGSISLLSVLAFTPSWGRHLLIGTSLGLSIIANPTAATLAVPLILLHNFHPTKIDESTINASNGATANGKRAHYSRGPFLLAMGVMIPVLLGFLYFRLVFDIPNVYRPTIEFMFASHATDFSSSSRKWIWAFTWTWVPLLVLTAALGPGNLTATVERVVGSFLNATKMLICPARGTSPSLRDNLEKVERVLRRRPSRHRIRPSSIGAFSLFSHLSLLVIHQFTVSGSGLIEMPFYFTLIVPTMFASVVLAAGGGGLLHRTIPTGDKSHTGPRRHLEARSWRVSVLWIAVLIFWIACIRDTPDWLILQNTHIATLLLGGGLVLLYISRGPRAFALLTCLALVFQVGYPPYQPGPENSFDYSAGFREDFGSQHYYEEGVLDRIEFLSKVFKNVPESAKIVFMALTPSDYQAMSINVPHVDNRILDASRTPEEHAANLRQFATDESVLVGIVGPVDSTRSIEAALLASWPFAERELDASMTEQSVDFAVRILRLASEGLIAYSDSAL